MDDVFKNILWDIEAALTEALPDKTNENWQKDSFSELSRCVNDSHLKNLISPCRNLVDLGGKRWRPLLLVLCYRMAKEAGCTPVIPEEKIFSLTPLVEFVHTASLIHDDILKKNYQKLFQNPANQIYQSLANLLELQY